MNDFEYQEIYLFQIAFDQLEATQQRIREEMSRYLFCRKGTFQKQDARERSSLTSFEDSRILTRQTRKSKTPLSPMKQAVLMSSMSIWFKEQRRILKLSST